MTDFFVNTDQTLNSYQKRLLVTWLTNSKTSTARIRSGIPNGWGVGNKTGTGAAFGSTNDLAIIFPPKHEPLFIGIYYTSHNEQAKTREDLLSAASKILIEAFMSKDPYLKIIP